MKKWIRIFLVCLFLLGGTVFFSYWLLNQFNSALDSLSASNLVIARITPTPSSVKTNTKQTPTPISETILSPAASTEPISFIFPKKDDEVYIGCTYQISFQSSTTINPFEIDLIDAGSRETIDPNSSGLERENEIEPSSQSLNWEVGVVWPGEYYIKASNINGSDLRSGVFTISMMPKDISIGERKKNCKESGGSF